MKKNLLLLLFTFVFASANIFAGTYSEVVTIFNNSCAFSSCHDSSMPAAGLDLSGNGGDIWSQIVNVVPQNAVAAGKNNMLVKPGDPARSFLYRKLNYSLHADSELDNANEGLSMPTGGALLDQEKELIRQWILLGAKNNNEDYVSTDILEEYYTVGGLDRVTPPAAPAPGEGFQLHFGPIFLEPGEEVEYVYKYDLQNEEGFEITSIETAMNEQSHHFLFFTFNEGAENTQGNGLISVYNNGNAITSNTKMIGGWAYPGKYDLPNGTAFKWKESEYLKYNYHVLNYSNTQILPAEIYVNVFTQDEGTAILEMHSEFHLSLEENFLFFVPQGVSTQNWTMNNFNEADNADEIHIWTLGSHTHQWGIDFDMYTNHGGVQGDQIYEGFYNFDYSFNQGFYSYGEPPFRVFDDFLTINPDDGIYTEASWDNQSGSTVFFGLTTQDEMYGAFVQYLVGDISQLPPNDTTTVGIENYNEDQYQIKIMPNPSNGLVFINSKQDLTDININIYDATGKMVRSLKESNINNGYSLNLTDLNSGFYFIELENESIRHTQKLMIQ